MSEETTSSSPVALLDSDACDAEESVRVQRWRHLAATGWAFAFIAAAIALVGWIRPAIVPGYGPSAGSMDSQWDDFEFRYPDAVAAFWQPWELERSESDAVLDEFVLGEVWWSESAQKGLARFTGLEALVSPHGVDSHSNDSRAGEQWAYQLWIGESAGDNPVRISAGLFEVEHEAAQHNDAHAERVTFVPFEPAMAVHHAKAVWVTIEPAGGVWVSDLSRPVAKAVLPKTEETDH